MVVDSEGSLSTGIPINSCCSNPIRYCDLSVINCFTFTSQKKVGTQKVSSCTQPSYVTRAHAYRKSLVKPEPVITVKKMQISNILQYMTVFEQQL